MSIDQQTSQARASQSQRKRQVVDGIKHHHPDAADTITLFARTFGAVLIGFKSQHVQHGRVCTPEQLAEPSTCPAPPIVSTKNRQPRRRKP